MQTCSSYDEPCTIPSQSRPVNFYGNQLGTCTSAICIGNVTLARRQHASDCANHARGGAAAGLRLHLVCLLVLGQLEEELYSTL